MPVDSLVDMSRRACARFSARITDIGDLDYELIRPVLLKIESPEKLHQLERASPQIVGKNAELWLSFIKRDIPDWHKKPHEPRDPKNWWKVYRKLREEARIESVGDEDALKAALADIRHEKEQNTAEIASPARRDLPYQQASRRARIQHNYISGRTGARGASKMTLMEKIRKETRDARASKMNRPMHELPKRATAVTQAPRQFVDEVRQQQQQAAKALSPPAKRARAEFSTIRAPRPPLHMPRPVVKPADAVMMDREARLSASKVAKKLPAGDAKEVIKDREARLRASKDAKKMPESIGPMAPGRRRESTAAANDAHSPSPRKESRPAPAVTLTARFLEDSDEEVGTVAAAAEASLQVPSADLTPKKEAHRPASLMRLSPQPACGSGPKRKRPPSLFHPQAKRVARTAELR